MERGMFVRVEFEVFGTTTKYSGIANICETVEEVLERFTDESESENENEEYTITPIVNGKLFSTLHTINRLISGSSTKNKDFVKVILFKKRNINKTNVNLDAYLNEEEIPTRNEEEREEELESELIEEQCRLADLGFNCWDCDPKAPTVIRELYEEEQNALAEEDAEHHSFELFMHGTVVSNPTTICDKPLPRPFLCADY